MRHGAFGWLLAGTLIGATGWFAFITFLAASLSQDEISTGWKLVFIALCPAATIPKINAWWILAMNCLFYGVVLEGLRLAWIRLHSGRISN
jgi:hypothetical protein